MVAETARQFEALEAQAQCLMSVFTKGGYEAVAPAIIQPADVFLDLTGEDLRQRTYVFADPEGAELCLRPDLTIPTCRLHLARHERPNLPARYCYNGPAFRFQPSDADPAHPREFRQCGIELFGESKTTKAETEVVCLIIEALRKADLKTFKIRIGDLGLFHDLLDALDMPERWRQRLKTQFWRQETFRAELLRLTERPASALEGLPQDLMGKIDTGNAKASRKAVLKYFEQHDIELLGSRSLEEIAESLLNAAEDATSEPIPRQTTELIDSYLHIVGPPRAAGARIKDLMASAKVDISDAIERFDQRLEAFGKAGIELSAMEFSAEFGRKLEYYTGFVFEVVNDRLGSMSPVAGGGRYDNLFRTIGAGIDIPAVGSAIHTERLLSLTSGAAP